MNRPEQQSVAIIVVAAGSGTRLGASAPKAFVELDERTILQHALRGVHEAAVAQIVVVAPDGYRDAARTALPAEAEADIVVGGETRQESVANGLAAVRPDIDIVLVHDAARALTPASQIDRVATAVAAENATSTQAVGVIPALPVVDTLKRVHADSRVAPVDRSDLVSAQTPQGFPREALVRAYAQAVTEHTDDAALFAAAGNSIRRVDGDERAFKVTTPADLDRARHLLGRVHSTIPQVGVGTDVHAYGGDGALWLAGLEWPGETPLSGHSDGDAVAHAMVDALLGAAGLGDIGEHFGTSHPEYAGAHADVFLRRTRELLAEAGFEIGNVSVQFQGNRPRFSARRAEAERVLSAALGGAPVSVTATTTDGLGFPGRGEGVSVTAVALVVRR